MSDPDRSVASTTIVSEASAAIVRLRAGYLALPRVSPTSKGLDVFIGCPETRISRVRVERGRTRGRLRDGVAEPPAREFTISAPSTATVVLR